MSQTLTYRQLEQLYVQAGGSPELAPIMAAIAKAESGGRTNAKHVNSDGSIDQGLWQINSSNSALYQGKNIYNPQENAKVAVRLAEHSGNKLRNWTTYTSGAFRKFLPNVAKTKTASKPANFGIFTKANYAGVDQGVDFRGAGGIPALGSGVVTDVGSSGIIEGGKFPYVIYKLTSGPYKGHFVYVAENFVPKVKKGAKIKAGQLIGIAPGKFPYIEIGFNKTGRGWNPVAPLNPSNPHSATPAGNTMNQYISGVAGLNKGGGSFLGSAENIGGDVVGGITNPIGTAAGLLGKGASAAGLNPADWVNEAVTRVLDAFAIIGGGFVFIVGFLLIAADIGLSTRAGKVAAAVPAGRIIAKGARAKAAKKPPQKKQNKHIGPSETGPQPRTRKVVHVYRDETPSERRSRLSGKDRSSQNKDDIPF